MDNNEIYLDKIEKIMNSIPHTRDNLDIINQYNLLVSRNNALIEAEKEAKEAEKAAKKQAKEAEKEAKKQAKEAEKAAKKQAKEAEKEAKKQAKLEAKLTKSPKGIADLSI